MGTILKYIFYVALILVIYLVAKGIYDGRITEDTTVKQVGSDIAVGTKQLINNTKDAIDEKTDDISIRTDNQNTEIRNTATSVQPE